MEKDQLQYIMMELSFIHSYIANLMSKIAGMSV